ncbi:MAG: TonB-dependent receptor [Comamonas sp.]
MPHTTMRSNARALHSYSTRFALTASCAAVQLLAGMPGLALADATLPEVTVKDDRELPQLQLNQTTRSGSYVAVPVKDLPASLDSVSSEQITERADAAVADAVSRTVGLTATSSPGNGGLSFASRGFNGVNSVGVAEDGIMLGVAAGTTTYPHDSWGYERFDVLRGPGSLMYGSGTMGATVNAVRKQPSRERSVEAMVGAGSNGGARAGIGATGSIGQEWSYRVDLYGERSDGERDLGKSDSKKIMSALRWQPRADLRVDLTADISDQKPERYFGTPVVDGRLATELRDKNFNFLDSDIRLKDKRFKAKVEWQPSEAVTLRNELYHFKADRHWKNIEGYDYDRATGTIARYDYLEIGHDLEQTGNRLGVVFKPGRHQIAAGWDISEARFTALNNSPYSGDSVVSAWNTSNGYWDSPDVYKARVESKIRQNAFYVEDVWKLSEQWQLMAGLRRDMYDFDRKDLISSATLDKSLGGTSWRLGASHRINESTNVYAQMSTGHDPVTSLLSLNKSNSGFSLTKGRQIELGLKQQLGNGRGEWTVAVFDIAKKDIITRDPNRPSESIQGGKQSSKGVEFTAALKATKSLRFEGNLAYVDAQFDELREGSSGISRAGNRPANIPQYSANLWAHYSVSDWRASLGLRHVGSRFNDNANTSVLPGYTVADAVLSWQFNPKTRLSLVGRNLTNKTYAASAYGSTQWLLGNRRSFEITAHMRF